VKKNLTKKKKKQTNKHNHLTFEKTTTRRTQAQSIQALQAMEELLQFVSKFGESLEKKTLKGLNFTTYINSKLIEEKTYMFEL
jgi:DNA polymerase II large subunit